MTSYWNKKSSYN